MKQFILLLLVAFLFSCKQEIDTSQLSANAIINRAIDVACDGNCDQVSISFTFRDRKYKSTRQGGNYKLERYNADSLKVIHDVLTNKGFKRFINDSLIVVPDSIASNIADGVNSVHYFMQLPYGLNAPAVHKKLVGEDSIKGAVYYEIEVTFSEEGGGTDFDDRFVYWIHKDNFTLDYLAYRYASNKGGMRFREAYNSRLIEGIRFADYNNYKPNSLDGKLEDMDVLFEKGELKLLSKIENENILVELLE